MDQGTNRAYPTGVSYDANGNASLTATMIYDVENRVAGYTSTSTYYGYDVQNKRIYTSGSYDSYGNPTGYTVVMYSLAGKSWEPIASIWVQLADHTVDQRHLFRRAADQHNGSSRLRGQILPLRRSQRRNKSGRHVELSRPTGATRTQTWTTPTSGITPINSEGS